MYNFAVTSAKIIKKYNYNKKIFIYICYELAQILSNSNKFNIINKHRTLRIEAYDT